MIRTCEIFNYLMNNRNLYVDIFEAYDAPIVFKRFSKAKFELQIRSSCYLYLGMRRFVSPLASDKPILRFIFRLLLN